MQYASAAGALACTRWGAQASIPHAAKVRDFIAQHPQTAPEAEQALRAFCGLT
ncbi:MAG: hypothetical protein U5M53_00095 [Rhodoferax sp.]|nr:hypothetical protein [Rhodoferax sp.]